MEQIAQKSMKSESTGLLIFCFLEGFAGTLENSLWVVKITYDYRSDEARAIINS